MSEEEIGIRMQNLFKSIYDAIDLRYMRPLKRQMFKCGRECLDDSKPARQAESCIEDCGKTLHSAMSTVQSEVNAFQDRIDRCLMDCQDSVRREKDESTARKQFNLCAERCVDKMVPMVSQVSGDICQKLEKLMQKSGL